MERSSQNAAAFVRRLAELTDRLAAKDIVVSSLHADWSGFGSWELQAQQGAQAERYRTGLLSSDPSRAVGPEVLRVFWDGRDGILTVETSPTRFCSAPNEWKEECAKGFGCESGDVLQFVEDYLTRRFTHDNVA
jgi:hypothetical protein